MNIKSGHGMVHRSFSLFLASDGDVPQSVFEHNYMFDLGGCGES